jgi:hypothetical protein
MKTHAEFSDYPLADLPAMPEGFLDSSWHNDTCPSYTNDALGLRIFIDYKDPALSESALGKRFNVMRELADGSSEYIFESDNWDNVLEFIDGERHAMRVFYTSDGEESGVMTLADLIANFTEGGAWHGPNVPRDHTPEDMTRELRERGWYSGNHDFGQYLVLNLEKLQLAHKGK